MPESIGGVFGVESEGESEAIAALKMLLRGIGVEGFKRFIQTVENVTV